MKKTIALILCLVLAVGVFAGCGAPKEKATLDSLMKGYTEQIKTDNMTFTLGMNMDVTVFGSQMSMIANLDNEIDGENVHSKGEMKTTGSSFMEDEESAEPQEEVESVEMYTIKEGDKLVQYTLEDGKWQKSDSETKAEELRKMVELGFDWSGFEMTETKDGYSVKGSVNIADIADSFGDYLEGLYDENSMSQEDLKKIDPVDVEFVFDQNQNIRKINLDMTKAMTSAATVAMEQSSSEGYDISCLFSISTVTFTIDNIDTNANVKITAPEV